MAAEAVSNAFPLSLNIDLALADLDSAPHIALAVSGGSDSMALLRLVANWQGRRRTTLSALTVDHGLRAASGAEARQVASWCQALGIGHQTLNWKGPKPETGVQAKARAARYELLTRWCVEHGASHLLTGHTLDDQAETVFMRRQRTSAPASLAAIRSEQSWHNGVRIFRPLLRQSRAILRDYCRGLGQLWLDDPSNEDMRYERVRTRRYLQQHLDLIPALSDLAVQAAELDREAHEFALGWLHTTLKIFPQGYGQVPRQAFLNLGVLHQTYILQKLLALFGGELRPEACEIGRLLSWLKQERHTRRTLAGAVVAVRKDTLTMGREWGRIEPAPQPVPSNGTAIWDGRFLVSAPSGLFIVPRGQVRGVPRVLDKERDVPDFVWKSLPVLVGGRAVETYHDHCREPEGLEFIRRLR